MRRRPKSAGADARTLRPSWCNPSRSTCRIFSYRSRAERIRKRRARAPWGDRWDQPHVTLLATDHVSWWHHRPGIGDHRTRRLVVVGVRNSRLGISDLAGVGRAYRQPMRGHHRQLVGDHVHAANAVGAARFRSRHSSGSPHAGGDSNADPQTYRCRFLIRWIRGSLPCQS